MKVKRFFAPAMAAGIIGAGALLATGASAAAGNAAAGKQAFGACAACHGTTPGARKLGPSLAGVVGRKAGSVPGFKYSAAMAKSGKTWTRAELDAYIANPRKDVPGNRMPYGGMHNAKQRSDLIAYLATLK